MVFTCLALQILIHAVTMFIFSIHFKDLMMYSLMNISFHSEVHAPLLNSSCFLPLLDICLVAVLVLLIGIIK